ncbi:MAG TPA: c-type cytochrome [Anaerolineales bacterium]|nr:c-type cytochrome [Anaerolineales bacterium]
MNRSTLMLWVLVLTVAILGGSVVGLGLSRWEQTARATEVLVETLPRPPEATSSGSPQPEVTALATSDGQTLGQATFGQYCDACHPGGGSGLGPALIGPGFEANFADDAKLTALVRSGTPSMPGFPSSRINDTQLGGLIAYMRLLGAQAAAPEATPTEVAVHGQLTWTGSYARDIQPIFDAYCVRCHGAEVAENGLRLDSYQGAMQGTRSGAVISPGSASSSTLVWVIQGLAAPQISMPHAERPLSPNRIQNIVLWIDARTPDN